MRFVPAPNEMDFAIFMAERWDAGDVDPWDQPFLFEESTSVDMAVLYFFSDLEHPDLLEFQGLVEQFEIRAGVEAPPYGFAKQLDPVDPAELFEWGEHELEGYDDYEDYEYERAHDEDREEDPSEIRESLRVDPPAPDARAFRPSLVAAGGFFVDGGWTLVWGDRLWRDVGQGDLEELDALPEPCDAYCQHEGQLVLRRTRYEYFVREEGELRESYPPVPVSLYDGVAVLGEQSRFDLPKCRPVPGLLRNPTIEEPSACGRFVRVLDRIGRGGVFDRTMRRFGSAGGPFVERRLSVLGPAIDGAVADAAFWRELLPRLRSYHEANPAWRPPSAFAVTPEGAVRHTDNGITFYEEGRLLFVAPGAARCVSFSPSGHEVIVGYDDEVVRIDVRSRRTLARWQRPARFRWLRIFLPAYEPDAYVEQLVSLWEVLADPNAREDPSDPEHTTEAHHAQHQ